MQITQKDVNGLIHTFQITIPNQEISEAVDGRLSKIGATVQIHGFRKGKVPLQMLKQRYGHSALSEAIEQKVEESIQKSLNDFKLRPALKPQITFENFQEGEDLRVNCVVEALPVIEKVDIEGFPLENLKADLSKEEIEKNLETLREISPVPAPLEKPRDIEEKDVVFLTYSIILDKKEIKREEGEGVSYFVGSHFFGKEFDETLKGLKKGDKKSAEILLPGPDFGKNAGKKAHIEFTIKEIMALEKPSLESLANLLKFKNLDALKEEMKLTLEEKYQDLSLQHLKQQIFDVLDKKHQFQVPSGLVDLEFKAVWKEYKDSMPIESSSKNEKDLQNEYREIAERRVRLGLLLAEIGMQNEIKVTNQEVTKAIYDYARAHPQQERQILEYYQKNPSAVSAFQAPIFEEKVVDYIIKKAKLKDRSVSVEELKRLVEAEEECLEEGTCHNPLHNHSTPKNKVSDQKKEGPKKNKK